MFRFVLPSLLLVSAMSSTFASESPTKRYEVDVAAPAADDNGPGETPGNSGEGDADAPACDYIGQADTTDCTITPDTPLNPPADAPDECIDWYYDDFWGELYGCA
jgi:hypothetical protein